MRELKMPKAVGAFEQLFVPVTLMPAYLPCDLVQDVALLKAACIIGPRALLGYL
jgi:hypothetical protein